MKTERIAKSILIGLPWLILFAMVISAYLPVMTGTKYLLPVTPRDPRDFFRGNYVDLAYEFSNIAKNKIQSGIDDERAYRFGDQLYLDLKNEDGVLKPVALYDKAEMTRFVRLKVMPRSQLTKAHTVFDLAAGIESFFAPEDAALGWEKALREKRVFAEVAIDTRGNARLVRLVRREQKTSTPEARADEN